MRAVAAHRARAGIADSTERAATESDPAAFVLRELAFLQAVAAGWQAQGDQMDHRPEQRGIGILDDQRKLGSVVRDTAPAERRREIGADARAGMAQRDRAAIGKGRAGQPDIRRRLSEARIVPGEMTLACPERPEQPANGTLDSRVHRSHPNVAGETGGLGRPSPRRASCRLWRLLVRAFSSEVDTGSREENASKQRDRGLPRFGETRKGSSAASGSCGLRAGLRQARPATVPAPVRRDATRPGRSRGRARH